MHIIQQIAFIILATVAVYLFTKKVKEIISNIHLGRDENISGNARERWRNVLLLALGQKKMFRYPLVGIMHFFIYAGFIIINIEVLEILLDGLFGTHRLFAQPLGSFYTFVIDFFEILAILVLTACIIFLIRRNILKLQRFMKHELDGWPRTDANLILITEIILMSLFLTMNSADRALQLQGNPHYLDHGSFILSGWFASFMQNFSSTSLVATERTCWWLHIAGIFAFLNYLPYSKHFHILIAFPNAYYKPLRPKGKMENMENVQKEVLYVFQPELATTNTNGEAQTKFGAKDIFDLSWKNLMDAYTCTECGRCTAACPANITGKLLSPLDIIFQLRRCLIMEESSAPAEWNTMFSNIENNFAPWKFSPDERDRWREEM